MKAFVSSLGLALLASFAAPRVPTTAAEPTFVDFNYDIARSYAGNGVSFLPLDPNPLPAQHLMGLSATSTSTDYSACKVTSTNETTNEVTVLIAISKCLGSKAQDAIITWAKNLQGAQETFFKNFDTNAHITYATAVVPGTCQAISEANAQGQSLLSSASDEVLPQDMEKFAAFSAIGRVLDALPSAINSTMVNNGAATTVKNTAPIAVVSFVDNFKSYEAVQQYELTEKISTTFNFKICESGENCGGDFLNCITLQEPVDLFMYSPFKVVSKFECASLDSGIPVTYVDSNNVRKCACTCPAGTELSSDKKSCVAVAKDQCQCVWANAPNGGYTFLTSTSESSSTNLNKKGSIPPPIPVDNYVAKGRTNQNDGDKALLPLVSSPHIDIKTNRICSPVYSTGADKNWDTEFNSKNKYADLTEGAYSAKGALTLVTVACTSPVSTATYSWVDYQADRSGKIDKLEFTSYGKYALELFATDYNKSATCPGCVAFVDNNRPQGINANCPKKFCDNSTSDCTDDEGISELTNANLDTANSLTTKFFTYQSTARNDACSAGRCDVEIIQAKKFTDSAYVSADVKYSTGKAFFSTDNVKADLTAKLTTGDPCKPSGVSQAEVLVKNGECKRCVYLSAQLKELWTDYKCGRDYDIQRCDGSDKCEVKQCLAVMGDTIAVASATIKSDVKTNSNKVVAELVQQGYNTETQIHVALQCVAFVDNANPDTYPDANCKYSSTAANLIEVSTKANTNSIYTDSEINQFVSWRYRVDTSEWKLWSTQTSFEFKKAETMITIEAWTQCGIVRKFYFYVNLHLNNDIKVCDNFRSMWYQTTSEKLTALDNLCTYPKSDFAELTFDYHANIGLQYSPDKLLMNISNVVCRLNYDGLSAVEIVNVNKLSPEIVTRFAVEAARSPKTSPLTKFHVTCDFIYKRFAPQPPLSQTCNQDFYITDCSGPEIDKPCLNTADCLATDQCIGAKNNPNSNPAPYEACGGNLVSVKDGKSAFSNSIQADKTCCEFCPTSYQTTCKTLASLPVGGGDIKRCEPAAKSPASPTTSGAYTGSLLLAATNALQKATQDPTGAATALLSTSALVALVALVVVKRRRTATAANTDKTMMEDAYYPLLN